MVEPSVTEVADQRQMIYQVEKALANQLRTATRAERRVLYSSLYDEYFQRLPYHPQLQRKASTEWSRQHVEWQLVLLRRFLHKATTFLEVGPGDCALALAVAPLVKTVYAIDVSAAIAEQIATPPNFHLVISDGCTIPVPPNSVQVAYSYQLMEHLHPDDAIEQLQNIYHALAPGGCYLCVTPNRFSGPHDISKYFDDVATGFHLKEYTFTELHALLKRAGFRRFQAYIGARTFQLPFPLPLLEWGEAFLQRLPTAISRKVGRSAPLKLLLGIRLVAFK